MSENGFLLYFIDDCMGVDLQACNYVLCVESVGLVSTGNGREAVLC